MNYTTTPGDEERHDRAYAVESLENRHAAIARDSEALDRLIAALSDVAVRKMTNARAQQFSYAAEALLKVLSESATHAIAYNRCEMIDLRAQIALLRAGPGSTA